MKRGLIGISILVAGLLSLAFVPLVNANRYTSPNYTIDASVTGASVSGMVSGDSYQMVTSGGESIIGNGQAGSYRLDQGYVGQLPHSLQLSITPTEVTLPTVIAGTSQAADVTLDVRTSASSYAVAVAQSGDLSNGEDTIAGINTGTLASPSTWEEGATKGFGLTLRDLSHQVPASKWQDGAAYARIPSSASTLYSRQSSGGGVADNATLRYRLDVATDQPAGDYTTTVTYTATWLP